MVRRGDGDGKPLAILLSEGQMSNHTGAKILYPSLPPAETLIADKGYDSDEFRSTEPPQLLDIDRR